MRIRGGVGRKWLTVLAGLAVLGLGLIGGCDGNSKDDRFVVLKGIPAALGDYSHDGRRDGARRSFQSVLVDAMTSHLPSTLERFSGGQGILGLMSGRWEQSAGRVALLTESSPEDRPRAWPELERVWRGLLERNTFRESPQRVNLLLASFVQWLRGGPHGGRGNVSLSPANTLDVNLDHFYGVSLERQVAIRAFRGGKLKTSNVNGEEFPPMRGGMGMCLSPPSPHDHPRGLGSFLETYNASARFAIAAGHEEEWDISNCLMDGRDVGTVFWDTLFTRVHNEMADAVAAEKPGFTDQEVFATAKLIVTHVALKVYLENYVSDALLVGREHARTFVYNPTALSELGKEAYWTGKLMEVEHLASVMFLERDHIQLPYSSKVGYAEFMSSTEILVQHGMPFAASVLMNAGLGRLGANNVPERLKDTVLEALAQERINRVGSFNDARRLLGLPPFKSFAEFGLAANETELLAALYDSEVENVEMLVGLLVEQPSLCGEHWMGDTACILEGSMALHSVLNSDVVKKPALHSGKALTKVGLEAMQEMTLAQLLKNTTGFWAKCPFWIGGECPWSSLTGAPSKPFKWSNFNALNGLDFMASQAFRDSGLYQTFANALMLVLTLTPVSFFVIHRFWNAVNEKYQQHETKMKFRVVAHTAFFLLYLVTFIPYTNHFLHIFFGDMCVEEFLNRRWWILVMVMANGMIYAADGAVMINSTLLVHHTLWFVFLALGFLQENIFIVKLDLILDGLCRYEFGVFLAFVARNLRWPKRIVQVLLFFGVSMYFVTRVLQSILVAWLYAKSLDRLQLTPAYVFVTFITIALNMFQFYCMKLYYSMWVSVGRWDTPEEDKKNTELPIG